MKVTVWLTEKTEESVYEYVAFDGIKVNWIDLEGYRMVFCLCENNETKV